MAPIEAPSYKDELNKIEDFLRHFETREARDGILRDDVHGNSHSRSGRLTSDQFSEEEEEEEAGDTRLTDDLPLKRVYYDQLQEISARKRQCLYIYLDDVFDHTQDADLLAHIQVPEQ